MKCLKLSHFAIFWLVAELFLPVNALRNYYISAIICVVNIKDN